MLSHVKSAATIPSEAEGMMTAEQIALPSVHRNPAAAAHDYGLGTGVSTGRFAVSP
jgi:hypothetical protein